MNAKIPLSTIKVASPCTASWDEMAGDDTTRFCGQCSQYVYNLSEMTKKDSEDLLMEHEGKMCVRFYRRADGTMMSKDCPVGWQSAKRRIVVAGCFAGSVIVAVLGLLTLGLISANAGGGNNGHRAGNRIGVDNPIAFVLDWLFPPNDLVQGGICPPPMPPAPQNGEKK